MWLGGLLIAVFAALFAGPYFVDWNSYRGVFEEEASRMLGRRVRVGGNVNVRLLPAPYVLFEDLRISDTTGIAGQPLFTTKSFKMWLAVPPLLKGVLEANKVELENPVLALAADKEGRGNWRTLLDIKELPFVPAGVKLQSVTIDDGVVSYSIDGGGELTRIDKISGEFSAEALAGPYSYRGAASFDGFETELRLATTEADANGDFRLTAAVSSGAKANRHKFDGHVRGLWDRPVVDGEISSKVVFQPYAKGDAKGKAKKEKLVADVRGRALADGRSLKINDLTISFDEFAQPQVVTGEVEAAWAERHQLNLVLKSRWLDVDLLTAGLEGRAQAEGSAGEQVRASGDQTVPLTTARQLLSGLLDVFPGKTDVRARLDVEQIKLGNETVAGLIVAMERSAGSLQLRTLRAILPGAARLDFSGVVDVVDGQPVFDGNLFLGGVSAAKVMRWAVGPTAADARFADGPFTVSGRMKLGSNKVMLDSATAEFSGIPVRGQLDWDDGKRRYVNVVLEGYEVDTRWFGLGELRLPSLMEVVSGPADQTTKAQDVATEGGAGSSQAGLFGFEELDGREVKIDLKAGRLTDGINTLHDVETRMMLIGRKADVEIFKAQTSEGLFFEVEGVVDGLGAAPAGNLRYLIAADDQSSAYKLADLWSGGRAEPLERDRFAAFAPVRLAGDMTLGGRKKSALDFRFDGVASGGHVTGYLKLDGGARNWRNAPVDLNVRSNAGDMGQLVASLISGRDGGGSQARGVGNTGRMLLKSVGIPSSSSGLLTFLSIDEGDLSVVFDGAATVSESQLASVDGALMLRTGDVRNLLRSVGLELPPGSGDLSYDGLADVTWTKEKLAFVPRDVTFGGAKVGGRLTVEVDDKGAKTIGGQLVADAASLPRLLSVVTPSGTGRIAETQVARAQGAQEETQAIIDGVATGQVERQVAAPLFSNSPFDFGTIDDVSGEVVLRSAKLQLAQGLAVDNAQSRVKLDKQQLTFELVSSQALGGKLSGNLKIEKAAAGAGTSGQFALRQASLEKISQLTAAGEASPRFGSGKVDVNFKFNGRGLTPSGTVSVASGSGELKLNGVTLAGLIPDGVAEAAEAALEGDGLPSEELELLLATAWQNGSMELGDTSVDLRMVDGIIQMSKIDVGNASNRIVLTSLLNAKTLEFDSEWRVVANDKKAGRPWPGVVVSRSGQLIQIAALPPQIISDALERELSVRKMERNVEELERLRRLDEEAAARQRARERELELESQRLEAERAAARAADEAARRVREGEPLSAPSGFQNGAGQDGQFPPQGGPGAGASGEFPGDPQSAGAELVAPEPVPASPAAQAGVANDASAAPRKRRPRRKKPEPESLTNQIFGID